MRLGQAHFPRAAGMLQRRHRRCAGAAIITGNGDVIAPDEGVLAIGSGGSYALAAARALIKNTDLSAREIAVEALRIAGEICIYSNQNIIVEEL